MSQTPPPDAQHVPRVLVVDDEDGVRFSLRGVLEDEGYAVDEAASAEAALQALADPEGRTPDLVFLDIWLPGMDGLELLERLTASPGAPPVLMISGHGNIETAVAAIKKGAHDFIEKPLSLEKVVIAADKALQFARLRAENLALKQAVGQGRVSDLTGRHPAVVQLREQIARVAPTEAWVLITGENGTGKEIVARSVHGQSRRAARPLIAVNCAAIPEELIESELFGHEKGAFTGAERAQAGKFELAHQGALFLDEIGDMSLKTQAKILRILQERSFERVGGRETIRVDVRVIAATNKDLGEEISQGRFREDLYYRLRVFPLHVPPLRERASDIGLFLETFGAALMAEHGIRPPAYSLAALQALKAYPWPGNVRELKNFVERMGITHGGGTVEPDDLPAEYLAGPAPATGAGSLSDPPAGAGSFKAARAAFEREYLESRYRASGGNVSRMAEEVGLERSYLYRKLKSYGIGD